MDGQAGTQLSKCQIRVAKLAATLEKYDEAIKLFEDIAQARSHLPRVHLTFPVLPHRNIALSHCVVGSLRLQLFVTLCCQ
jgi:hypothetical protein